MLKQNRSETDDLHRTIAVKDAELITERNVIRNCFIIFYFQIFFLASFTNRRTTSSTIK